MWSGCCIVYKQRMAVLEFALSIVYKAWLVASEFVLSIVYKASFSL